MAKRGFEREPGYDGVCVCVCMRTCVLVCMHVNGSLISLLTYPLLTEPEVKDIPLQDDLITLDNVRTLKDLIGITEHYILAGFCSKR